MIDLADPSLDDEPASVSSLRAQLARVERERNHFQDECLGHLRTIQDLQRQLTAARAVAEVI